MKRLIATVMFVLLASSVHSAHADSFDNDMWIGDMKINNLFMPHRNNCDSTEVFIPIGENSSYRGFCIEKEERASDYFENARQTCVALGKRLPEPVEYKVACKLAPTGLTEMTNGWEWASNRTTHFSTFVGTSTAMRIGAYIAGADDCTTGFIGLLSGNWNSGPQDESFTFRCVR